MKLLVPIETEALSRKIIEKVIHFSSGLKENPTIILLHVVNADVIAEDIEVGVDIEARLAAEAESALQREANELKAAGLSCQLKVLRGFTAKTISQFAKDQAVDLRGQWNIFTESCGVNAND